MNTYRIERVDGKFEVVMYDRSWFRRRRHVVEKCDRLMSAEQMLLGIVGEAYSRKLDRDRFAPVTVTIADCEPRTDEEHIYTAIVLQSGDILPKRGEMISENIYDIAHRMTDKKFSPVEKRLFLHRFMTWYAKHNPDYTDPRLEPMDEFYNMAIRPPTAAGQSMRTSRLRGMLDAVMGRQA